MNDHETFHDLDARASAAVTDLRASADARPRPSFDPERSPSIPVTVPGGASHRRSIPRRTLAAAAAAVVLLAGAAVWVAARPDEDRLNPAVRTTDAPRPFVLGSVPDGFSLAGAGEATSGSGAASGAGSAPLVIYGPAPDQPRLGISVLGAFDPEELDVEAEAVEVDGVRAYVLDGRGFGPRALVVQVGATSVIATGRDLGRDELVDLFAGARIVDRSVVLRDGVLPEGWTELGEEPSLIGMANAAAATSGSAGTGSFVAYLAGDVGGEGSDPDALRAVYVASVPGDEVRLHAPELTATESERTTVRGHEAVAGTSLVPASSETATSTSFVSWFERPGELIRLTAIGVPVDELVRMAEDVEPIGREDWKELVERTRLGDFDDGRYQESGGNLVELARGRFDDGTAWVLRVQPADGEGTSGPNASLDLQVALGGDSSSGSSSGSGTAMGSGGEPVEPALGASTTTTQGGRTFGAGFLGADVDTVVLVADDGTELGRAEIVSGSGRRAWVAEATDGVVEVVAHAADGTELGRLGFGAGDASTPPPQSPTTVVVGGP